MCTTCCGEPPSALLVDGRDREQHLGVSDGKKDGSRACRCTEPFPGTSLNWSRHKSLEGMEKV